MSNRRALQSIALSSSDGLLWRLSPLVHMLHHVSCVLLVMGSIVVSRSSKRSVYKIYILFACCRNRRYWWCLISYRTLCSSCSLPAPRTSGFRILPTPPWIAAWLFSTWASILIPSTHCFPLIPPLSSLSAQLLRLANRLFAHSSLSPADCKWIQWNWNRNRLKKTQTLFRLLFCTHYNFSCTLLPQWMTRIWISLNFIAAKDCSSGVASQLVLLPSRDCKSCSNRFTHTKYM